MRSNGFVTENAEFNIDPKKYQDNYVHIFQKDKCECEECAKKRDETKEEEKP